MHDCKTDNSCEPKKPCGCPSNHHCGCANNSHEHSTMSDHVLHLVKCAKHDLLKEKVKKILEAKIGKNLDKVAEIAVEAALTLMQNKDTDKLTHEQLEENLMAAWKR